MTRMTFAAAMVDAVVARMHDDPTMTLIGSAYLLGPAVEHPALNEVRERYADRVIDEPPISESAVAGLAIGSAMSGCRALAHFGLAAFAVEAWSQFIHEAGVAHHQSGGQITVPAVFVMMHGVMPIEFSQHSRSPYAMLANCPGIQIVLASTPADVKGLMTTALMSDNPTVVMNHPLLMAMEGEVPEGDFAIPFGEAEVKRAGRDVSIIATSHKVQVALQAAEVLAAEGVSAEVVDPRTIVPLDREAILASVRKTGRVVVVDDSPRTCGFGAEIGALVAESAFGDLKAPVIRLSPPDVPIPRSTAAQTPFRTTPEKVAGAVRSIL